MMKRLSLAGLAAVATLAASPALASFHLMKIEQAIGGVGGDTTQQAIQLRMRADHQNLLNGNARLVVRDAAGANPVTLISFTADAATGLLGRRVLIVSPAFAAAQAAISADFVMTSTIPASYLAAGRLTFEDTTGTVLWSLAWGGAGYTGPHTGATFNDADGNFGPAFGSALPSAGTEALLFTASDPAGAALSTNNLADYGTTAGAATFTNNAGQSGTVSGAPQADLSIVMADSPDPVQVGGTITYTLTASNAGPQPATSVQVLDVIPPGQGLAFVSASGDGWTCGSMIGVVVPCSRPGLAAGATAPPVTVVMTAGKVGTVLNTAWVRSTTTDPVPGNDSDTEETLVVGQSLFYPLIPCRLADTRGPVGPSGGPALQANASRDFPVVTLCGVPADARAVAIIVTVTQATETGNLRLYPAGSNLPTASTINFVTTTARANNAIVTLGSGGAISVRCDMAPASTGTTHFLFDVTGYFR